MNENVDIDAREVAALEERLYSQCHHSYEVTTSSEGMSLPMADNVPSRIVSKTSVVNNPQSAQLKSKMKRYWATTEGYSASPKPFLQPSNTYQKQSAPSELTRTNGNGSSVVQSNANEVKKMYTMPYQSLLGNSAKNLKDNRPTLPAETVAKVTNESCNLRKAQGSAKPNPPRKLKKNFQPKKNHQSSQHAVQKKLGGLMKLVNSDTSESRRQRFQGKKAKAIEVRKFHAPRVVAQVFLDSSDDESKPTVVMPQTKVNIDAQSDGETDEVVIVPLPEPPKICIDCSDDEVALDSFALPQAKKTSKKATVAKFNSPRCLSPSNSSIMSDDFIGLHDRSRLNDSFSENVPNDDELECSIEGKRGGDVQEGTKSSPPSRDLRAPSISSEETICTSSDTTDQDKHRQESGKGSKSKSLPTSRNEIVAAGENGKKNELSNKKGSSQATVTKQLLDRAPPETITERSISSTPSGTVKKGSTKKATPSMQASEPIASNSSAKCKSPISMALELARKHFEGNDSFETATGSAKKKSKKGRASDANQLSITQDLIPPKRVAKKSAKARKKVGTDDSMYELLGESTAEERADRLPLSDDSVSSESDYELTLAAPQGTGEQTISTSLANETASKQPSVAALPAIEGLENISSESEYEESFSQALKSTPKTAKALSSAKRVGRKRKQYNSETFSDEDFACMLTDIVRAVSDTDSDEEEEVEDGQERQEKESNHATEVPDDAVTSTTVIAELDCGEQEKQTKVGEPSAKKKKRSADASKTVSASIVGASKPNGNGKTMEKCSNAASSTTASAEHECETQGKQTKAGGSSTTKKKKRSFDASNAASSSIVEVGGNQGDEGDNIVKQTVAATSTTAVDVAERADGPSTKKKRRSNDISNASIASIVDRNEDVCSEQLDSDANQMAAPTTRSQIVQELPDCAWNEEMKQFYNEVWMEEDFTLSSVMQKMPRGKKHWPILQQDLYPDPPKKDVICNNCGDRGHMRYKCKNTPKPAICYMCGEQGHREPRCPRSMCLNCGARTRNFVRGCNACARDLNTTCRLCGVRGHVQRSCPDMWRRYHSTTEDNVALRNQFQTNMKPKYCCICCKSGHQAHICNAAYRIFGQAVPTVHIKSYQQTYAVKQQDNKESTTVPRYNLFSDDANECELNLHGLASNPNGFYYRFAKSSGLLEKHEQRLNQEEEAKQQWLQQLQQNQQEQQQPEQEKEVDKYENRPQNVAGSSRQENNDPVAGSVPAVETEDSNYSFSGLLAEKEHVDHESVIEAANEASPAKDNEAGSQVKSVAKAPESWPDFIPLGAEPEAPLSPEQLPPKDNVVDTSNVMEAKVPLTEAQAKMLLSSRGSNFLKEAAKRHSLKLSISFEMVGNVLSDFVMVESI
uniref:Zinc finger CCHC domain-containing protein 7 n=1 Tax=Anopheles atroparvus TaxID=41427 RepID=A0A182JA97_ANOAO